jgi:hypothetical protein
MGAQLIVLAAGRGRRFGGLKQLTPVGPAGEALMDYTVHDALGAGFDQVVLVIRREIGAEVRAHVEAGFGRRVDVRYVFQETDGPAGPRGTGHAVLAAKAAVHGPFAVANADDVYGHEAVAALGAFLAGPATSPPASPPIWAMVAYRLADTLPPEGTVARSLVRVEDGFLMSIEEVTAIRRHGDGAGRDRSGQMEPLPAATPVSMNLWGFGPEILAHLAAGYEAFRASAPPGAEFYLPTAVGEAVAAGIARVRVLEAGGRWCGLTAAADLAEVRRDMAARIAAGAYPSPLWA